MAMSIQNYILGTGLSADKFTFPHNPTVFSTEPQKFMDQKDFPYNFSIFGQGDPIMNRIPVSLVGHFEGSSRSTYYQSLSKHYMANGIKQLQFSSDKMYLIITGAAPKSNDGARPLFIDYVASGISPFGVLFSTTQKTGGKTSAEENEGNVATPIESITLTAVSGHAYICKDDLGNGFTFTASGSGTFTYYLIKLTSIGAGNTITDYGVGYIGTTKQKMKVATSGKSMLLQLAAAETINDRMNGGTWTDNGGGITALVFKFRDGFSGE